MPSRKKGESTNVGLPLSQAIQLIWVEIELLAIMARDGELEAEKSRSIIEDLIWHIDNCSGPFGLDGWKFASPQANSKIIKSSNREHISAHHAVVEQARDFLRTLWFHLDEKSFANARSCLAQDVSELSAEEIGTLRNSTGLNTERITMDWSRAKAAIEELLNRSWIDDFSPISNQLLLEEAALKQSHSQLLRKAAGGFESEQPEYHVTLLQMASIVNRTKKTLQRLKAKDFFPRPAVEGGDGKPQEWPWSVVRPLLEAEYSRELPKTFPADKFQRS